MTLTNSQIGVQPFECPTCGDLTATPDHIKTCKKLRAADPSELDEMRHMQWGDDWAQNWPYVDHERFADWRE